MADRRRGAGTGQGISAGAAGSGKFVNDRPYADPEKAARKILEIANTVEAVQDGRIHIEKVNGSFLFRENGTAPNTRLAWTWRLPVAGWSCTRAERSSASRRRGVELFA